MRRKGIVDMKLIKDLKLGFVFLFLFSSLANADDGFITTYNHHIFRESLRLCP